MADQDFIKLGDILPRVAKSIGLDEKLKEQDLLRCWPEVVGKEIASKTRAVKFKRGILFVHVEHGAWIQELHFMEKEIVRKLKDKIPEVRVKKVRFGSRG